MYVAGGQVGEAVDGVAEDVGADRRPPRPGARPSTSMPKASWVFGPSLIWKRGSSLSSVDSSRSSRPSRVSRAQLFSEADVEAERVGSGVGAGGVHREQEAEAGERGHGRPSEAARRWSSWGLSSLVGRVRRRRSLSLGRSPRGRRPGAC